MQIFAKHKKLKETVCIVGFVAKELNVSPARISTFTYAIFVRKNGEFGSSPIKELTYEGGIEWSK